jgi:thiol:disulfide interchange protein/DsbC/DsbD-like thiol-disulfide interchange protein
MARLFVLLFSLLVSSFLTAQTPGFGFGGGKTVAASKATLVSEVSAIAPGKPFTVALQLAHPDGWHSYYQNSGGLEKPPVITWTLPEGFTAGPIQWPVPEVKDGVFGKSFIYPGSPAFLIEITPPANLKPGESITLAATANWQICQQTCRDESAKFSITLPVAENAVTDSAQAGLFTEARAKLPASSKSLTFLWEASNGTIRLKVSPAPAADPNGLDFIPDQPFVRPFSEGGSFAREGDSWVLTLKQATKDVLDNDIPLGETLSGMLVAKSPLDGETGATAIRMESTPLRAAITFPPASSTAPVAAPMPMIKFATLLGLIGLGGLILNLMPCVFPVIGLKILGFVQQAGEDRKKIVAHGLTFTLGVLISFWVLSGILFAARTAALAKGGSAEAIGWGYQLQQPWVVLSLMLLMFALALNLFGVFEIGAAATSIGGSLQAKQGLAGTLFSGMLATVVATPCSAPFLGVALGTAIGLPGPQFFLAFTAMGIGLSLPYLVLSAFPKLIAFLPRPGAWMESFKQAMAFLLFATTGYLLWVYTGQIGLEHMLGPVFGLSLAGLGAWIYGRWSLPHRSKRARVTATLLALVFATGGVIASLPPKPSKLVWETWSSERVETLLKEGKPVFVDFTAQWCATCQVNKKRAYTPEVIALMQKRGIVALKADKTKPDPAIEQKLRELNRTAIPVNVFYRPGKEPVITPELLSEDYLLELFKE